ncbi:hypothetical protein VTN96DRAFT_3723 [Rasamsonia emersonii]
MLKLQRVGHFKGSAGRRQEQAMTCGCAQRELHARPLQIRCDAITEDGGRRKRYCGGEQPHVSLARHQDFAVQIGCTANTKGSYTSLQRHAHNSPALQAKTATAQAITQS